MQEIMVKLIDYYINLCDDCLINLNELDNFKEVIKGCTFNTLGASNKTHLAMIMISEYARIRGDMVKDDIVICMNRAYELIRYLNIKFK